MSEIENHTVKLLQEIRSDLKDVKLNVSVIEAEMKAGFLGIKQHLAGFSGDVYSYDRRIMDLETDLSHFKADLTENNPPPEET